MRSQFSVLVVEPKVIEQCRECSMQLISNYSTSYLDCCLLSKPIKCVNSRYLANVI